MSDVDLAETDPTIEQLKATSAAELAVLSDIQATLDLREREVEITPEEPIDFTDVAVVRGIVRAEECKDSRKVIGRERDDSIRDLLSVYRGTSDVDENDLNPQRLRQVRALRQRAADKIYEYTAPTIEGICRKYGSRYDIAKSGAMLGFVKAMERFDTEHGEMFLTYAIQTIRGEILHALRDETVKTHTYSRTDVEKLKLVEGIQADGIADKRAYTVANTNAQEVRILKVTVEDAALRHLDPSIEIPNSSNGNHGDIESEALQTVIIDEIAQRAGDMNWSDKELSVLYHYFGLAQTEDGGFGMIPEFERGSQTQISAQTGVSQSYISRLIKQISKRLKSAY